jgi:hypothetical protein
MTFSLTADQFTIYSGTMTTMDSAGNVLNTCTAVSGDVSADGEVTAVVGDCTSGDTHQFSAQTNAARDRMRGSHHSAHCKTSHTLRKSAQ